MYKFNCPSTELAIKCQQMLQEDGFKAVISGCAVISDLDITNVMHKYQVPCKAWPDSLTDYDRTLLQAEDERCAGGCGAECTQRCVI